MIARCQVGWNGNKSALVSFRGGGAKSWPLEQAQMVVAQSLSSPSYWLLSNEMPELISGRSLGLWMVTWCTHLPESLSMRTDALKHSQAS